MVSEFSLTLNECGFISGARAAKSCDTGQTYFSLIDECVDAAIGVSPSLLRALTDGHVCPGRVVRTLDDLEAIRTCDTINGSLTIALNDANADFTALYDVETIRGLDTRMKCDLCQSADVVHIQDRS